MPSILCQEGGVGDLVSSVDLGGSDRRVGAFWSLDVCTVLYVCIFSLICMHCCAMVVYDVCCVWFVLLFSQCLAICMQV